MTALATSGPTGAIYGQTWVDQPSDAAGELGPGRPSLAEKSRDQVNRATDDDDAVQVREQRVA